MSYWLDILLNVIWPIASTLTPIILGAGFLWLQTKFPTKTDFEDLKTRVGHIEVQQGKDSLRLSAIADDAEHSPTRIELLKELSTISSRLAHVEATGKATEKAVATQNDYLHTLIEKGLK